MRRTWLLWSIFAVCLAIGMGAMGWISVTVLRVEENSRRQALAEENIRLALWRMDSTLAPIIAQEMARPYFAYSAFTSADEAYTRMFRKLDPGDVLVPSPLLTGRPDLILLHFQFPPEGEATSPQVPTGNEHDLAVMHYTNRERIKQAQERLAELSARVSSATLLARLPRTSVEAGDPLALLPPEQQTTLNEQAMPQYVQRSVNERVARDSQRLQIANYNRMNSSHPNLPARVSEGVSTPVWVDGCLLLARRVSIAGEVYVQGCWLDWPAVRSELLLAAADLLPAAQLQPVDEAQAGDAPRRLANLPVLLEPGAVPPIAIENDSATRVTLAVAWGGLLIGSGAIAALLAGAITLSQRRAAFVSAVTHELRTPLTTVSMYAEMLEEGMVTDEPQRRQYLSTLRAETSRLGHLVENVLAYSRIERGSLDNRMQTLAISRLIENVEQRLRQRAGQAKLELRIEVPPELAAAQVRADASAVEQILFNLVDNAAKYAAASEERELVLSASNGDAHLRLTLQDKGPGISADEARRLFRPFSKSAREAANSAPGVGLGLALSRRLAREMRGDLRLEESSVGARFTLTLPLAKVR